MQLKSVVTFAALAAAAPLLNQRDVGVKTVTTWEIDTVTSYTTLWVGMPGITASSTISAASSTTLVTTSSTKTTSAEKKATQAPLPVTAVQDTPSVINPIPAPSTTTLITTTPTQQAPTTTPVIAVQSPTTSPTTQSSSTPKPGKFAVDLLQGAAAQDGPCTPDQPCSGDITHYNPSQGVGSCGPKDWATGAIWTDNDMVVAISHTIMGSQSNGGSADSVNPLCNRSVYIKGQDGGKDMVAKVVDKCAGCSQNFALDLSPALFDIVAPNGDGRVHDVEWYWV